jgi:Icc-related predicted phosphoesterase
MSDLHLAALHQGGHRRFPSGMAPHKVLKQIEEELSRGPVEGILIAGDLANTPRDGIVLPEFFRELSGLAPGCPILVVAGNHDEPPLENGVQLSRELFPHRCRAGRVTLLRDQIHRIGDLTVAGLDFLRPNRGEEEKALSALSRRLNISGPPLPVDVVLVHEPPRGYLDRRDRKNRMGSRYIRRAIEELLDPRLVVFGHCHEQSGKELVDGDIRYFNACSVEARRVAPWMAPRVWRISVSPRAAPVDLG